MKSDILWKLGYINEAIAFLSSLKDKNIEILKKIYELKEECIKICGFPHNDEKIIKCEKFIVWLRQNGAILKNTMIKYYGPDYRGVNASKEIKAGEIIVDFPMNLFFTIEHGEKTPTGKKLVATGLKFNKPQLIYITIYILSEMHNPDSKLKPYLDVFPNTADNFPILFSEQEKSLLKGTYMQNKITEKGEDLKKDYDRIAEIAPEFKQVTLEEFIRVLLLIKSRYYYFVIQGKIVYALVPFAGIYTKI